MNERLTKWKNELQSPQIIYPDLNQEIERLRSVHQLNLDFDQQEETFDQITELAKSVFQVEMALITIVDSNWQWFKSCIGVPHQLEEDGGTPRDQSFCQYLFVENQPFQVTDATEDDRFKNNPLVTNGIIRFYAGVPLRLSNGHMIGSLCVLDSNPNHLSETAFDQLEKLANWAMTEIEVKQKVQDLSEQQQAMNELVERNSYLTAGIEHSSSSIVITDAKQPHNPIIYVNQAFTDLTGYSLEEVIGRNCNILQGPETNQETVDYIKSQIDQHEPVATEILNYRKNQSSFWNELIINPITDDAGHVPYFIGIQQDITSRKNYEQDLVKELFEKKSLFNALPELIIMIDEDGYVKYANSQLTPLTGYSNSEMVDQPITRLMPTNGLTNLINDTIQQGTASFEQALVTKDLEYLPFQWKFLSLPGAEEDPSNIVAIGEDIRDRLQLQKDVEYAGHLQKELLQPNIDDDTITLKFLHKASHYVSGDSYGYDYDHEEQRIFIYLVDVMGHGVATALQTSTINLLFNQIARADMSVKDKVEWVNRTCTRIFPAAYFATAFCAEIDLKTGHMTYVAAGINYFAYEQEGQTHSCTVPGALIGIEENMTFTEHTLTMNQGDALYFMTDGIYEQINQDDLPHDYQQFYTYLDQLTEEDQVTDDTTAICLKLR